MKDTSDRLIIILFVMIVVFGVLCFFVQPQYEKGAAIIIGVIVMALTNILSFKFGVHQASLSSSPTVALTELAAPIRTLDPPSAPEPETQH